MSRLTWDQAQEIIGYLQADQDVPDDYRHLLFPQERREYELVYACKEREEDILQKTWGVPLQPVKTFSVSKGHTVPPWTNRLIFGDNLQVMKRLLEDSDVRGKVKLIYIDPPFATKQVFQSSMSERAYQDRVEGAQFIEFLRKRIILLRELLSPDGSLFLHMDQRMAHYAKVVLDEVFQEHNFRNEIVLPGRAAKNLQQQFGSVARLNVRHDTLLWYSASLSTRFSPLWIEKHNKGNAEGHWHHFWSTADRPTMRYTLFGTKPDNGQWTWKKERAMQAVKNYERFLKESGGRTLVEYWLDTGRALEFVRKDPDTGKPHYWRAPAEERLADTMWSGMPIYSNGTKYPTEKSEYLLEQIIQLASEKGDLVLDAFAGSGTTCAVAEKLGRRWISIDCGKLAIYTVQKRLLNLREGIGNKGKPLPTKAFTLYNAGLYDFARMKELPWEDYRRFALQLFQVRDQPHIISGITMDGFKGTADVLIFNFKERDGVQVDQEYIRGLHEHLGSQARDEFFLIAPASRVTFLEDYIEHGDTRYYILRIPYSIIDELHDRPFQEIRQPADENGINNTVEAVGFDFVVPPRVKATYTSDSRNTLFPQAIIYIKEFRSEAMTRRPQDFGNRETLSMVMVDFDYKGNGEGIFDLATVFYRDQIEEAGWKVLMDANDLGPRCMIIYMDIFGNELREIKTPSDFGIDYTCVKEASTPYAANKKQRAPATKKRVSGRTQTTKSAERRG